MSPALGIRIVFQEYFCTVGRLHIVSGLTSGEVLQRTVMVPVRIMCSDAVFISVY